MYYYVIYIVTSTKSVPHSLNLKFTKSISCLHFMKSIITDQLLCHKSLSLISSHRPASVCDNNNNNTFPQLTLFKLKMKLNQKYIKT